MKLFTAGIVGLFAGYFVSDTPLVAKTLNEATRLGTIRGVEECIKYSSSGLLSDEAVRDACAHRFQKPINDQYAISGRANTGAERGKAHLEGNLENTTPDLVTTWVWVRLHVYNSDGIKRGFDGELTTWIEPLSSKEFRVEFEEADGAEIAALTGCPSAEEKPKNCFTWTTIALSGVSLN